MRVIGFVIARRNDEAISSFTGRSNGDCFVPRNDKSPRFRPPPSFFSLPLPRVACCLVLVSAPRLGTAPRPVARPAAGFYRAVVRVHPRGARSVGGRRIMGRSGHFAVAAHPRQPCPRYAGPVVERCRRTGGRRFARRCRRAGRMAGAPEARSAVFRAGCRRGAAAESGRQVLAGPATAGPLGVAGARNVLQLSQRPFNGRSGVGGCPDYLGVAQKVNKIELYKQAAEQVKVPVPKDPMRVSKMIDGVVWDGKDPKKYANSFKIKV